MRKKLILSVMLLLVLTVAMTASVFATTGELTAGQSRTFSYSGGIQQMRLDSGAYKLECYG
ncbi:MAG: hypothetical protein RSB39_08670, partial [Oscillospiraceae bacterium]